MSEPLILDPPARLAPRRAALLIIDMQKDFCIDGFAASKAGRPLAAAQSIVPGLQDLLQAARAAGVLVCHVAFWTLPDHGSDSGPWLAQRRRSTFSGDRIAIAGTVGAEFIEELRPAPGELVIRKHRYSAFKGTGLDMLLRARNIETVVVTGVSTNVCVESTAREAFENNFYVFVPRDAVASWDAELHAATLRNVEARLGLVTGIADVKEIWNQTAGGPR
jgi:ureidoacrylate peracid hydrolase